MIASEQMFTSDPLDHCAAVVNNTRVVEKQNGIDFSIEDIEISKELMETD